MNLMGNNSEAESDGIGSICKWAERVQSLFGIGNSRGVLWYSQ
jgi:hypothetical protein